MIVYVVVERKNGNSPSGWYGQNVGAMGTDSLDHYLHGVAVKPLGELMHEDKATLEQAIEVAQPADRFALERRLEALRERPEWHDPHEGLKTINALTERLPHDERYDGVHADLATYRAILNETQSDGDEFRLNIRTME
jgi:hypothetical protein